MSLGLHLAKVRISERKAKEKLVFSLLVSYQEKQDSTGETIAKHGNTQILPTRQPTDGAEIRRTACGQERNATSGWCDRSDVVVESRTGKCASGRGVLSETQVTEPRVERDSSHTRIINKVRNDIVAVSHLIVSIAYLPHSTMWEIV